MKIGILTFHWATNYGAVIQCYALQIYLESLGHHVEVINYKPLRYIDSLYSFFRYRKFLHLREYLNTQKKEKSLESFRDLHLNLTEQIHTCSAVGEVASRYDLIISGSDQVTNPYFLQNGEGLNIVTPTYFLGFPFNGKRIGYALSFGCTVYPSEAKHLAISFLDKFDAISVRERSGIEIAKSMGREDVDVVPDPTLLMSTQFYLSLVEESMKMWSGSFIYGFFIRNINDRKIVINRIFKDKHIVWNNEDGDYSMQGWLSKINHSNLVITDSFHCVVMCLKLHKQFIVVTEKEGNVGMNDRLFTLLSPLELEDRIISKSNLEKMSNTDNFKDICWLEVDSKLSEYSQIGKIFLSNL